MVSARVKLCMVCIFTERRCRKRETEQGMLMVKGTDLHVNRLSLEKGEVDLSGNIDSIAYSDVHAEQKQGENLFARLFR